VSWAYSFYGDFDQTIHIQTKSTYSEWVETTTTEISAFRSNQNVRNTTITGLQEDTEYYLRILSTNEKGVSVSSDVWKFKTRKGKYLFQSDFVSETIEIANGGYDDCSL